MRRHTLDVTEAERVGGGEEGKTRLPAIQDGSERFFPGPRVAPPEE